MIRRDGNGRRPMTTQSGSSMVFALIVLFSILALAVAGLSTAASGLTLANNYKTGAQAMQAAESGIVHAVSVIDAYGVTTFPTDVVTPWTTLFGSSALTLPGTATVSYTVSPAGSPAVTNTNMWLTSVGQAEGESTRTIRARLALTGPFTCGAIDLPSSGISADFRGNSFEIDGNDYPLGSTTPDPSLPSTLGISTRTQTDATTVLDSLNQNQEARVDGTAVPNQVASVSTCSGPSADRIRNSIVPTMLAQPGVVTDPEGNGNRNNITGSLTLGSSSSPQITYFAGDTTIKGAGNVTGFGIMIVDGGLTIEGSLAFTGLIVVRGSTQITTVTGNATTYGAIWTTDLSLTVGGSAAVYYSSAALQLANSIPGNNQPVLPQKVAVVAWSQS
jgi:hypothetical protein